MEECAEVAQEASKAIQFGLNETYSEIGISNKERLEKELRDLDSIIQLLYLHLNVNSNNTEKLFNDKVEKLNTYLVYSNELGKTEKIEL